MENAIKNKKWNKETILNVILVGLASIFLIIFFVTQSDRLTIGRKNHPEYIDKLFDDSYVHIIKITMPEEKWEALKDLSEDKIWFNCDIDIDGETIKNVGVRVKGKITLTQINTLEEDNYSLKVEFDHNDKNQTYYGLDKLSLNSNVFDDTFVRDYIGHDMMRFIGVPAPYTSYVNLFVNDVDMGLYLGIEEIEDAFLERNYGKNYGALYEISIARTEDRFRYLGDDIGKYTYLLNNPKTKVSEKDAYDVIQAIKYINDPDTIDKGIDIDKLTKLFVIDTFLCHYDGYLGISNHNFYLYEKNGKTEMIPWDYDGLYYFGYVDPVLLGNEGMEYIRTNMLIDYPVIVREGYDRILWRNLIANDKYKEKYYEYYLQFLQDYFDSGYFEQKMDNIYNIIYPYLKDDQNAFHSTEQFVGNFNWIKQLMLNRRIAIQAQLDGKVTDKDKQEFKDLLDSVSFEGIETGR